jgi:hypothetical protein
MRPEGAARFVKLGKGSLPVLAKGEEFISAVDLDEIAKFVGVEVAAQTMLAPDVLLEKWINVLRIAQRSVAQLPAERLREHYVTGRAVRDLTHHVFRIGEAFVETAIDDVPVTMLHAAKELGEQEFNRTDEYVAYGDEVIERLLAWRRGADDKALARSIETYYGTQSIHQLLERSTWHSAQHVRQLHVILERFGIAPVAPFKPEDLAGLPLPEEIWV